MEYRGLQIELKRDFPVNSAQTGYVITDGVCNVLPGATWAKTPSQARALIDAYIEAGGPIQKETESYNEFFSRLMREPVDSNKFWGIVQ